ncbi:MAG TPA: DUF1631 family protein [Solimonas sp.]|nr:DUF1631 family protein [Solimonas sp.]
MTATLHPLSASTRAAHAEAPRGGLLVAALRERVTTLLGERLQRMFDGADDFLFEMSEKASNNDQQRLFFDTMRAVRLERSRIAQFFRQELGHTFSESDRAAERNASDDVDFSQLAMQDTEELEETIAIKNMGGKAETAYAQPLWELDLRLRWLEKHQPSLELPRRALAPSGFCEAFRVSVHALDVAFDVKLVILKLFDRLVLGDLTPLYTELLAVMTQHGVQAEKAASAKPAAPPPPPAAQVAAAAAAAVAQQAAALPSVDPQTLAALQGFGDFGLAAGASFNPVAAMAMNSAALSMAAAGLGASARLPQLDFTDAMLAGELLNAARGQDVQDLAPGQAWAMTQRAGLVGRMFNDILEDANLPPKLAQSLEALRFPVIKTALADIGFFARPDHPVRSLVNELASMAAATRAVGPEAIEPFEQLVQKVREQFDPRAEAVRPKAHEAQALSEGDTEQFLDQQLAQGRLRRQAIIDKTRKVVAQELQLRTLARPVAPEVQPLLRSGWAPMMAMRLLRHGAQSEDWKSGMDLLQRLMQALDPRRSDADAGTERQALRADLAAALASAGLAGERVQGLLKGYDLAVERLPAKVVDDAARPAANEALAAPADGTAPGEPPAQSAQLLQLLLGAGSWFRVYDHEHADTRWLKVMSYDPEQRSVMFAEFDGQNTMELQTTVLLDDLCAHRTEPIDPTPAVRTALRQLRESSC